MRSCTSDEKLVASLGEMIQALLKQCVPEGTSLTKLGLRMHFSQYSVLSSENVFKLKSMLFSIPFFKHTNGIESFIITSKKGKETLYKYSKMSKYPSGVTTQEIIKEFENLISNSTISENYLEFFYTLQMTLYFAVYSCDKDMTLLVSYLFLLFTKEV